MSAQDKLNEFAGKAKEGIGNATGNEELKAEGQTDQAQAKVADAANNAKDKVEGVKNSLKND
ncbi:CsbD family protein [Rothia amarae]|uniref:CsbD family protein n=1 Tax=Rothia amarae TaxID=169480 RepID=A0A7H2BJT3_9MICC|nr:CsbD family protein [Rothia amarae]QNV39929.1 CsbD family protein [Rothia amarae]SIK62789.1 CsbD family protein [Mycobacteroides abscessus subsp. abscessus]